MNNDEFLVLLQQHRSALLDVDASGKEAAKPVELDQTRVGRLSRMDALQAQAMSQESDRRRTLELKRIDAAIDRMSCGDYGYCTECGNEIARQRLRVDPSALMCIDCARKAERR